jgi:hypothetical protein
MPADGRDYGEEYRRRKANHPDKTAREAAGHRRRRFQDLTARAWQRIVAVGQQFGLSRRQAQEQYDTGGFRPFAHQPAERVPQSIRQHPERAPLDVQRQLAYERAQELLGGLDYTDSRGRPRFFDDAAVRARIFTIDDPETLLAMISADRELWLSSARFQYPGNPWWYHHA